VVWGDQIWITTADKDGHKMYAVCVSFQSGQIVYDVNIFDEAKPQKINARNSYATPSPVVEEGRVYVHYGTFGTACLDTKTGKILWQRRDLNCEHMQGPVSSPVLFGDLVILHLDGTDVQFIAALKKATGETVWRVERPKEWYSTVEPIVRKAYITPLIIEVNGKPQMISNGAQSCHAYDPLTGSEFWRVWYGDDSTIARPVANKELVFVNAGLIKPRLWAVRLGGKGDVSNSHVVWKIEKDIPAESSPVIVDELIYIVSDKGKASCIEAKTGKIIWQEQLEGEYGASPVYADGHVYFFNKEGKTIVIKHGREFKVVATNQLGDGFMASPAIVGRSLILRSKTHLYRIEKQ
jgi:outer membrane protein assembly factor BamB